MAASATIVACGDSDMAGSLGAERSADEEAYNDSNQGAYDSVNNTNGANNSNGANNTFVPEEEKFIVRQVATTENYVFVPNEAEESTTVARIDGRDLSVVPLRVGSNPREVVASELEGIGAVAYVLCEGSSSIAVIRADQTSRDGKGEGDVRLIPVPREVNAIKLAPDGRHAVAYIDPERPLEGSSVNSLQAMSIIRLADDAGDDEAFELSVTRLIRDVEFTENGELFVVGKEGVNRLRLSELSSDALLPRLDLGLDAGLFPPTDLEIEAAPDASFMLVRSSTFAGVAIYELPEDTSQVGEKRIIELDAIPTDIDLVVDGDTRKVLISVRDANQIVIADVDEVLAAAEDEAPPITVIDVDTKDAGLAQITPDQEEALIYSSLAAAPSLSVLDFATEELRRYEVRNQIVSVAITPDSSGAVVVHEPTTTEPTLDPEDIFRSLHALTLFDIASGYRRPVALEGEPIDILMTQNELGNETIVYVLLDGADGDSVMRLEFPSFKAETVSLPREARQIGRVAGQVFVSQEAEEGRITFFDVNTGEQRTVSGYELNAEID